jgi:hypothetical protein
MSACSDKLQRFDGALKALLSAIEEDEPDALVSALEVMVRAYEELRDVASEVPAEGPEREAWEAGLDRALRLHAVARARIDNEVEAVAHALSASRSQQRVFEFYGSENGAGDSCDVAG